MSKTYFHKLLEIEEIKSWYKELTYDENQLDLGKLAKLFTENNIQ